MNGAEFKKLRLALECSTCGHSFRDHGVDDADETICWIDRCQCADYHPAVAADAPSEIWFDAGPPRIAS